MVAVVKLNDEHCVVDAVQDYYDSGETGNLNWMVPIISFSILYDDVDQTVRPPARGPRPLQTVSILQPTPRI
jgi:hypothetical protein